LLLNRNDDTPVGKASPALLDIFKPVNNYHKNANKHHINQDPKKQAGKQEVSNQVAKENSKIGKLARTKEETVKQTNKEEMMKSDRETANARLNATPVIQDGGTNFYEKLPFNTYKEGSVNDISSASSFSGNRSPR